MRRSWPRLLEAIVVLVATLIAAWPVFDEPFANDAQILRAAFARGDVFGDWNHPFLSYLLNKPAAMLSLDPWALRVTPFFVVVAETLLVLFAVARRENRWGAWLAALWFVLETRRRQGLLELGDWDLAGAFLMGLLLWLDRYDDDHSRLGMSRPAFWGLLALAGLGAFSSYLMIVPIACLTLCLAVDARRRRADLRSVAALAGLLVLVAIHVRDVFRLGAGMPRDPHTMTDLFREMWMEGPIGRSPVMAIPLVAGIVWLARDLRRTTNRFALATLIVVPIAITYAWRYSHVNGGYYMRLVTPLLIWAAGAATGRVLTWVATRHPGRWAPRLATGVLALAIGAATFAGQQPLFPGASGGVEMVAGFDLLTRTNQLPIVTDWSEFGRMVGYERARHGQGNVNGITAQEGPADIAARVRHLGDDACKAGSPPFFTEASYYVVLMGRLPGDCVGHLDPDCREILKSSKREVVARWFLCSKVPPA